MNYFADTLMNNESLRYLIFCRNNDSYASFTCILCSKSSILGTYQSNHTLERLCSDNSESWLPVELTSVLQINRENSKSQIARLKIIKTHFSGIDINTLPFTDMTSLLGWAEIVATTKSVMFCLHFLGICHRWVEKQE